MGLLGFFRRRKAERLMGRGYERLEERDFTEALAIAGKLEGLRHTSAFDIGAQAHAGLGEPAKALALLERGVHVAPDCWLNWELLGNTRSDQGDYDGAAAAYTRALACPEVGEDWVRLNQGVLANRRRQHEEALRFASMVKEEELAAAAASVEMDALHCLGRAAEALALGEPWLRGERETDDDGAIARMAASRARIRVERGDPREDVRAEAMAAQALHGFATELQAVIRDIDGQFNEQAQYYRLELEADLPDGVPEDEGIRGYYVNYDVVAESPEGAVAWAQEMEALQLPEASPLRIASWEVVEPRPKDLMGVYGRGGRIFHTGD